MSHSLLKPIAKCLSHPIGVEGSQKENCCRHFGGGPTPKSPCATPNQVHPKSTPTPLQLLKRLAPLGKPKAELLYPHGGLLKRLEPPAAGGSMCVSAGSRSCGRPAVRPSSASPRRRRCSRPRRSGTRRGLWGGVLFSGGKGRRGWLRCSFLVICLAACVSSSFPFFWGKFFDLRGRGGDTFLGWFIVTDSKLEHGTNPS